MSTTYLHQNSTVNSDNISEIHCLGTSLYYSNNFNASSSQINMNLTTVPTWLFRTKTGHRGLTRPNPNTNINNPLYYC